MFWGCTGGERKSISTSTHTSENKFLALFAFLPLEVSRGQSQFDLFREASSDSRGILSTWKQGLCVSDQRRSQGLCASSDCPLSLLGGTRGMAAGDQIYLLGWCSFEGPLVSQFPPPPSSSGSTHIAESLTVLQYHWDVVKRNASVCRLNSF